MFGRKVGATAYRHPQLSITTFTCLLSSFASMFPPHINSSKSQSIDPHEFIPLSPPIGRTYVGLNRNLSDSILSIVDFKVNQQWLTSSDFSNRFQKQGWESTLLFSFQIVKSQGYVSFLHYFYALNPNLIIMGVHPPIIVAYQTLEFRHSFWKIYT